MPAKPDGEPPGTGHRVRGGLGIGVGLPGRLSGPDRDYPRVLWRMMWSVRPVRLRSVRCGSTGEGRVTR